MTVADLIERLGTFDPAREVRIANPTHNYWGEVRAVNPHDLSVEWFAVEDGTITDGERRDEGEQYESAVIIHA